MIKQLLNENFANKSALIPVPAFIMGLAIAAVLSLLLGAVYVRFGHSISNRRQFARNFLLLSVTTTLVIAIVKSSLALSLGLVGALSIVRFRAAIKEPEELVYLFLAISVGLGIGAGQVLLTVVAILLILGFIVVHGFFRAKPDQPNLYLTVTSAHPGKLSLSQIQETLSATGASARLKHLDESAEMLEAAFLVDFKNAGSLEDFSQRLRQLSAQVKVSCVDDRGLGM